ncbi:baseplate assembly protein [Pseudomonas sp. B392_1p]|uniref:baseplate assembly protein n=1 Tax=Pseudomonas sp. B392_1p TaxID=3457507 RepID=UPI003FD52448
MSVVDLSALPRPNVLEELDFEATFQEKLDQFRDSMGEAWTAQLESDPVLKLLEVAAYSKVTDRARVNDAARAVLLAFAQKGDLDQVCAGVDVKRLTVVAADPLAVPPIEAVMEDDESLRSRGQMAFERLSVAGPRSAYKAHALAADGRIADVSAESPAPCEALISVLSRQGDGTAGEDILQAVRAALNDESVRPIGDRVTVQSVEVVPYSVDAVLYLLPGPEAEVVLAAAQASLHAYISTQRRIGRDIRRSALYAALHVSGVQRVELLAPAADVVIDYTQAAYCAEYRVTEGGEDE